MIHVPVTGFNIQQARRIKEITEKPPNYRRGHEIAEIEAFSNTMADLLIAASEYKAVE